MEDLENRIIDTAMELFVAHGFKRITMDQVANTLHISKRTLYETFMCKEDLIDACLSRITEKARQQRERMWQDTEDPLLLAIYMTQHYAEYCQRNNRLMQDAENYYPCIFKKYFSYRLDEVVAKIQRWLEDAAARGIVRKQADPKIAANAIVFFTEQVRTNPKLDNEMRHKINSEFVYTYMRGLLTESALERYKSQEETFRNILKNNHNKSINQQK